MDNDRKDLAWEEIKTEHIVKDEWIDFRKSAYRFPDGSVFEPFYSYSRRNYVVIVASDSKRRLSAKCSHNSMAFIKKTKGLTIGPVETLRITWQKKQK